MIYSCVSSQVAVLRAGGAVGGNNKTVLPARSLCISPEKIICLILSFLWYY